MFRSRWFTVPLFLILFFGGGFLGSQLAAVVAPDSRVAEFISFFALPVAFFFGVVAWAGAAIPCAVRILIGRFQGRQRSPEPGKTAVDPLIPPGSFLFVPLSVLTSSLAGLVVAFLATRLGFAWVVCLYVMLGLGYGLTCWKLARAGYLEFPTES